MTQLSLSLLGPFQATLDDEPITNFATDKTRALLAYLAVEAEHPHRRDALAGLLWPDQPQHNARQSLRQALSYLRQAIGDQDDLFLLIDRQTVQFNPDSDHWLDVAAFKALAQECKVHRHSRLGNCLPCLWRLERMAGLYGGSFLEQFFLSDSNVFEEWALLEREWLHRQAVEALSHLADYYERRGDYEQARQHTWKQVELEPWREESHRRLMRLLALDGQRSAALAQYKKCRQTLAEELGVEPMVETTALYEQINRSEIADLQTRTPANLPSSLTSFVGRKEELADLADLLSDPSCRLVTLSGPGGIGKTRLALAAAEEHVGVFEHGVYYATLAAIASSEFIAPTIADALQLSFFEHDLTEQVLNYLREKEVLLVLDGMEHLVDDGELLAEILARAPGVTLLVTSRERVNLQEEWVYEVGGLTCPPSSPAPSLPGEGTYSALDLFQQRARQMQRSFSLSGENVGPATRICRLVEGMPLGIELAAAWVRARSCETIASEIERNLDILATRLRNVPQRHRSIRATFEHSWNLLSPEEQAVFARLSVFRGGFRRQAAEQVADASLPVLLALADKSLLRCGPAERYQVHQLLRQYAAEKLAARGTRAEVEAAHGSYYAAFLQEQEGALKGASQQAAAQAIRAEIDNVRSAWRWACTQLEQQQDRVLATTVIRQSLESLYLFYMLQDRYQEGEEAFGQAAAALGGGALSDEEELVLGQLLARQAKCCEFTTHSDKAQRLFEGSLAIFERLDAWRERALPLHGLGYMAHLKGEYAQAERYLESGLAIYEKTGDRWGIANVFNHLCMVARRQGAFSKAKGLSQKSLSIRREIGDQKGIALSLSNLGLVYCAVGEYAEAQEVLQESLHICRQLDYKTGIANVFTCLCQATFCLGQVEAAEQFARESLELYQDVGDRWGVAISYNNLGQMAMDLGNFAHARRLFREGIAVYRQIGIKSGLANTLGNLGEACCNLGEYVQARQHLHEALQIAQEINALPIVLDTLVGFAPLLAQEGETVRALELLAFAIHQPEVLQAVKEKAAILFSRLAAGLPPEEVRAARTWGRGLDLEGVVGEVLGA